MSYGKKKRQFLEYQLCKKKTKAKERAMRKKLLTFLLRLINLLEDVSVAISIKDAAKMRTILKVYEQQHQKAYGNPEEKIKDRIVSLSKPYIRPIVRGKEVKPVEFGAKVKSIFDSLKIKLVMLKDPERKISAIIELLNHKN